MSKLYFGALVCAFVVAGFAGTASAQTVINARIVPACGTPPFTYNPGTPGPVLIDVNGNVCGAVSIVPSTLSTPSNIVTDQAVIAVTGTAVQLPAHASLVNGISIKACNGPSPEHTNVAVIYYGASTVANTGSGLGHGDSIGPGERVGQAVNNSNVIWINGTAGDCVTFGGN